MITKINKSMTIYTNSRIIHRKKGEFTKLHIHTHTHVQIFISYCTFEKFFIIMIIDDRDIVLIQIDHLFLFDMNINYDLDILILLDLEFVT